MIVVITKDENFKNSSNKLLEFRKIYEDSNICKIRILNQKELDELINKLNFLKINYLVNKSE